MTKYSPSFLVCMRSSCYLLSPHRVDWFLPAAQSSTQSYAGLQALELVADPLYSARPLKHHPTGKQ